VRCACAACCSVDLIGTKRMVGGGETHRQPDDQHHPPARATGIGARLLRCVLGAGRCHGRAGVSCTADETLRRRERHSDRRRVGCCRGREGLDGRFRVRMIELLPTDLGRVLPLGGVDVNVRFSMSATESCRSPFGQLRAFVGYAARDLCPAAVPAPPSGQRSASLLAPGRLADSVSWIHLQHQDHDATHRPQKIFSVGTTGASPSQNRRVTVLGLRTSRGGPCMATRVATVRIEYHTVGPSSTTRLAPRTSGRSCCFVPSAPRTLITGFMMRGHGVAMHCPACRAIREGSGIT
jgi:hypothetical protein